MVFIIYLATLSQVSTRLMKTVTSKMVNRRMFVWNKDHVGSLLHKKGSVAQTELLFTTFTVVRLLAQKNF